TGVQTCALPISKDFLPRSHAEAARKRDSPSFHRCVIPTFAGMTGFSPICGCPQSRLYRRSEAEPPPRFRKNRPADSSGALDPEVAELAVQRRAPEPETPRDCGQPPSISAGGEP